MHKQFSPPPPKADPTLDWDAAYLAFMRDLAQRQASIPHAALRVSMTVAEHTLGRKVATMRATQKTLAAHVGMSNNCVGRGIRDAITRGLILYVRAGEYAVALPEKGKVSK